MIEVFGDAWELSKNHTLCITVNNNVRIDNRAVMGRGIAKQAATRFPKVPFILADHILDKRVPMVFWLGKFGIYPDWWDLIAFPTKYNFWEKSSLELIKQSVEELDNLCHADVYKDEAIFLPRPGCSNGGLDWKDVKPLLEKLDNRFYIVEYKRRSK